MYTLWEIISENQLRKVTLDLIIVHTFILEYFNIKE